MKSLAKAILALKTEAEVENFLRDLCTPGEIKDFNERWVIAQLLDGGDLSYRQIADKAAASITTVTRVARFLKDEPYCGYALVLKRINKAAHGTHHRA
jgi:TrpR-related protein YerC/YecD